jgi:twinkle protein
MGAGTGAKLDWIDRDWDILARFDDIVLCYDADRAGQDTVKECARRLGLERVRVLHLPAKDPNDCLVKLGMTAEEFALLHAAAKPIAPEELRSAAEFIDDVARVLYPEPGDHQGCALPWRRMSKVRLRRGEVSLWTGINGHGKTQALNQVIAHCMDQGERACIASLEMATPQLLARMCRQLTMREQPSRIWLADLGEWFADRLWIVTKQGSLHADRLLEVFAYARRRHDCRVFVIDSLMRCGIAEDGYPRQADFVRDLVSFAIEHDAHAHLVAHASKPKDESQIVGKLSIKGSGTMSDNAFNTFSVWRNKKKERKVNEIHAANISPMTKAAQLADLREEEDAVISIDKQRLGTGWEGMVKLWFDPASLSYRDDPAGETPRLFTVPAEH